MNVTDHKANVLIQWPPKVWKLFVELPPFTRGLMGEWLLRKAVKSREGNVAEFFFYFSRNQDRLKIFF